MIDISFILICQLLKSFDISVSSIICNFILNLVFMIFTFSLFINALIPKLKVLLVQNPTMPKVLHLISRHLL